MVTRAQNYSLKNELVARALGDILKLRFSEVNNVKIKVNVLKRPVEQVFLQITFDCNPDKTKQLTSFMDQEIEKIKKGIILQTDLEKIKANYLKERKQKQSYNSYDMDMLINYFWESYNMNDPKNFENIVNTITIKDKQTFAKVLIQDSKSYRIVFKSKK